MATERMWKITIVGGSENGNEFSFPADKTVLIGRSRATDLRLKEPDVSGKHLELFVEDGIAFLREVSRFPAVVNGTTKIMSTERAPVNPGDTIALGQTVRVRLDEIPVDPPQQEDPPTGETRFFDPAVLDFTPVFPEAATDAAQEIVSASEGAAGIPPIPVQMPSPAAVESTPSTENVRSSAQPDIIPPQVSETRLLEDLSSIPTARPEAPSKIAEPKAMPSPAGEVPRTEPRPTIRLQGPAIFPSWGGSGQDIPTEADFIPSGSGLPGQTPVPASESFSGGGETLVPEMLQDDNPSNADDTQTDVDDGKTRQLETRVAPMEEILAIKNRLERKRKWRRVLMGFVLASVFVGAGGWWYLTRPGGEEGLTYPEPIHEFGLRDESGALLLKVDYPWNENADVSIAPGSNGVTVVSAMGRDRDVPYFLQLETRSDPEELKIGLKESVARWFKQTEEAGLGFSFDERVKQDVSPKFFEDAYPGSCQAKSLYGVRFIQFDYKRTQGEDARIWHGIGIYFRRGDTVYLLRREMPESFWARGGYYLKVDSNLAIFSRFTDEYWESPGLSSVQMMDKMVDGLVQESRDCLAKNRPSEWISIRQAIDSILVRSWRGNPDIRYRTMELLSQFREKLRVFYYQEYYAFQTAKENRDEKRMGRILQDVKSIFRDQDERYFYLVRDGEVW